MPRPSFSSDLLHLSRLQVAFADPSTSSLSAQGQTRDIVIQTSRSYTSSDQPNEPRRRIAVQQTWRKDKTLGQGGFGTVYLQRCVQCSQNEKKGQLRAVKEVKKLQYADYNRELEAIALFSHERQKYKERFVESFGWYESENAVFVTMEYLPRGDLEQYVTDSLPEDQAQRIVGQVAEALSMMHERGFTHRDLKPANILVSNPGPHWWVKLADFGVSKRAESGITDLRTRVYTPAFAAPEVLHQQSFGEDSDEDDDTYTNAVDIWATGLITLLILVGETTFADRRVRRKLLVKGELPTEKLAEKGISSNGLSFLQDLLRQNPEDRLSAIQCLEHEWLLAHNDVNVDAQGANESPPDLSMLTDLVPDLAVSDRKQSAQWSARWTTLPETKVVDDTDDSKITARRVTTDINATSQSHHPKSELEATAQWNYTKGEENEISLREGERVTNIEKIDVDWWVGQNSRGERGLFPGNYVELASNTESFAIASFDYEATEDNEISFPEGAKITKIKFPDKDWWLGEYDGRVGLFPSNHVELNERARGADSNSLRRLPQASTPSIDINVREERCWTGKNIAAVALSPDGKLITTVTNLLNPSRCLVRHWSADSLTWICSLTKPGAMFSEVTFSPDGRRMILSSLDSGATRYERVESSAQFHWKEIFTWKFDTDCTALAFSPDGQSYASGSPTGCVKLYPTTGAAQTLSMFKEQHSPGIYFIKISPDSKLIAVGTARGISLWDVGMREQLVVSNFGYVCSIDFSPTEQKLMAVYHTSTALAFLDVKAHTWIFYRGTLGLMSCVAYAPGGSSFVLGNTFGQLYLCEFDPSGRSRLSAEANRVAGLDQHRVRELERPGTQAIVSIQFFPDRKRILVRMKDDTVKVILGAPWTF